MFTLSTSECNDICMLAFFSRRLFCIQSDTLTFICDINNTFYLYSAFAKAVIYKQYMLYMLHVYFCHVLCLF